MWLDGAWSLVLSLCVILCFGWFLLYFSFFTVRGCGGPLMFFVCVFVMIS